MAAEADHRRQTRADLPILRKAHQGLVQEPSLDGAHPPTHGRKANQSALRQR